MSTLVRWRSGVLFFGVACLGILGASGFGGRVEAAPEVSNDKSRDAVDPVDEDYHLVARADPNEPDLYYLSVVNEGRGSLEDYTVLWDFGDGVFGVGEQQEYRFDGPGRFEVAASAIDENGNVVLSLAREVEVQTSEESLIAVAGETQTVDEDAVVYLFAGESLNPGGVALTYEWRQLDGPEVMILDADQMTASFVAPPVESALDPTFELTVSDGITSSSDTVVVRVLDSGGDSAAVTAAVTTLTADAGPDQWVSSDQVVTLDGSRSSGPAGLSPTFRWTQRSGPTVAIVNATRPTAAFVAPTATGSNIALSFRLLVTAGTLISSDTVDVVVAPSDPCLLDADADGVNDCLDECPSDPMKASPEICGCGVADTDSDNDGVADCLSPPPTLFASAGADVSILLGSSTLLSGSGSGGTAPYSYRWSPTVGLSSSIVPQPFATPTLTTTYTLTVTDAQARTATDSVVVTVQAPPLVANAGVDRTITAGSSTTLSGSATGGTTPYAYRWSPTTGLNNPNVASPTAAPTANTTYTLTVTDAAVRTASDSVLVTVTQPGPALTASVQSLGFGTTSTSMTFEVWNSGGQTLNYTLSDNASWLTLSPTSGSSTGEHDTITTTVSRAGLTDNNYNGVITVTPSAGAVWSIAVSMSVSTTPGGTMTAASRTSGVAPLSVVFDAVRSDSGVAAPPLSGTRRDYASYNYAWTFGDNAAATWAYSGKSKNEAGGFVAAHVFENPGSYRVTLQVTDTTGSVRSYEQTITVTDPEVIFANNSADSAERTLYVSSAGTDSNNGSLNRPLQTWARAKTMLFASNGPRRVLLRRGDSFAPSSGGTVSNRTGPFQVGAYGSGANPVINSLSTTTELLSLDATATDVRLMDLNLVGNLTGNGIRPGTNTLVFRCRLSGFSNAVTTSEPHGLKQGVVIAENTIDGSDGYGIYFNFGQRVAFLGNLIQDVNREHLVRCYITHSMVQHNIFRGGHNAKTQLKFVGYFPTGNIQREVGIPTETVEFSIVSDNTFEQAGPIAWMITLGPVDNAKDQRMQDIVFERNVLRADPDTQVMLYANNNHVTVRNNVFDGTLKPGVTAIRVTQRGIEPPPVGYNIFNNTCYSAASSGGLTCAQIDSMASQTTVRNNFTAVAVGGLMIGNGGSGLVQSNNVLTTNGRFVNAAAGDFRLTAGSTAIDAGAASPYVLYDKNYTRRTVNGDGRNGAEPDLGAFEYVP